jgi:hypothetical protein
MSRIRTVKPEWIDDEALHAAGVVARLMSVQLVLLADDYGNGRAHPGQLSGRLFWNEPNGREMVEEGLAKLRECGFLALYEVRGQRYFTIRNWSKHQKVDKPGKPRVPGPGEAQVTETAAEPEASEKVREGPEKVRESLATDLDLDLDQDHDRDPDRERARASPAGLRNDFERAVERALGVRPMLVGKPVEDSENLVGRHPPALIEAQLAAFESWLTTRKKPPRNPWLTWLQGFGSWTDASRGVARARTHEDFEHVPDVEEQLRQQGLM